MSRKRRIPRALAILIAAIAAWTMGWANIEGADEVYGYFFATIGPGLFAAVLISAGGRFLPRWARITIASLLLLLNPALIRHAITGSETSVLLGEAVYGMALVIAITAPLAALLLPEEPRIRPPRLRNLGWAALYVACFLIMEALSQGRGPVSSYLVFNPYAGLASLTGAYLIAWLPTTANRSATQPRRVSGGTLPHPDRLGLHRDLVVGYEVPPGIFVIRCGPPAIKQNLEASPGNARLAPAPFEVWPG